jgi:hypothetical protein
MAVDPTKPRTVLIIHGVQTGEQTDLIQDRLITELLQSRLGNMPLKFTVELFRYEDLNNQVQRKYQRLIKLIALHPIGSALASNAIDLIGDVVTARLDTSTAAQIRKGFKDKIVKLYDEGSPCYIVAHSLGSIYAFDVVNELIKDACFFDRHSRRTWPVQGLITLGSPIGISMFKKGRPHVQSLGKGTKMLRWLNFWDRTDPVVSGKLFGQTLNGFEIAEKYRQASLDQGWVIRDRPVDTGKVWLMAHVGYWELPAVGDGLFDLVAN